MTWTWRFESADGAALPATEQRPEPPSFPTQADAESWIGEAWRELLENGVDQVSLLDGAAIVYGPMSLHAP